MVQELFDWQEPDEFYETVQRLTPLDSADSLTSPRNQIFLDAWIAAEFAKRASSELVCLIKDDWPDFQVSKEGLVRTFESVEADMPGRRRGDEYKGWKKSNYRPEHDKIENWRARRDAIPQALDTVVQKKIEKNYDSSSLQSVGLVIYLNLGTYGEWRGDIEIEIFEKTRPAASVFQDVWVLWDNRLYRTWPEPLILTEQEPPPRDPEVERWLFEQAIRD